MIVRGANSDNVTNKSTLGRAKLGLTDPRHLLAFQLQVSIASPS